MNDVPMTEDEIVMSKPWWLSKGVWGPVISILSIAFAQFGLGIDANLLVESLLQFVALLGALLGWWGRIDAKQPIDSRRVLPGITLKAK